MTAPAFDYTNRSAIVQHGVIYYSPNWTWPVIIPPCPTYFSDPFHQPCLNSTMFKQPVWWSHGWAWQIFIPLAPSFTLSPFGSLCAMPCIEEVRFSSPGHSEETHFCYEFPFISRYASLSHLPTHHALLLFHLLLLLTSIFCSVLLVPLSMTHLPRSLYLWLIPASLDSSHYCWLILIADLFYT